MKLVYDSGVANKFLVYVGLVKATVSALLSLVVLPTARSLIAVHM